MTQLPRIAIGTIQRGADSTALIWALMDALEQAGLRVQSFLSRAYFSPRDGATAITGLSPRHLDSWLMSQQSCREVLVRGSSSSDLAIVEGSFAFGGREPSGGDFQTLCRWLDLPRLAIIDTRLLDQCTLPGKPDGVSGLLLDRVRDTSELCRLQTLFETIWNVPVLGWLGAAGGLRDSIEAIPPGRQPSLGLCHSLGEQFAEHAQLERIYRIATERPFVACESRCIDSRSRPALQVAVAYDQAFRGYFPDTLDLLELQGATIRDFSPLGDERLPPGTDVVYFGCGHPELFAAELAENDCMMLALKSHLCRGGRMYAECGGLAYLCQQIELPDGSWWPMVGALPATARLDPTPGLPQPVEITLAGDTWLGEVGEHWRGYLNPRWSLAPTTTVQSYASEAGHELDLVGRHHAIGSRLHLNWSAQGNLLDRFFVPHEAHVPAPGATLSRT